MATEKEYKIEEIIFEVNGIEKVVDVIEYPGSDKGTRAYFRDTTLYYDMPVFEAGLKKADRVTRLGLFDQDKWTSKN